MPKKITPLSDNQVRNAKIPPVKNYTLFDGGGLYLLVTTTGSKLWRLKYRFLGRQRLMAIGAYSEVTLLEARERREKARKLLANGIDPLDDKKAHKVAQIEATVSTFELFARQWHEKRKPEWTDDYASICLNRLDKHVFPFIGKRPIKTIETPELVALLEKVEKRSVDVAHRVKTYIYNIFHYAQLHGVVKYNPASDLRKVISPVRHKHRAAPITTKEAAPILLAIDSYKGSIEVECALKLAPLLFVRPGELRSMEWKDVDLDSAIWNIPAHKMKMKEDHIVPLSRQAVEILERIQLVNGHLKYAFPSCRPNDRCISENTLNAAIRRLGITKSELTAHGFRAMARTMIAQELHVLPDIVEAQLAHKVADRHGRAYNRTIYLDDRIKMMQEWADYLDKLKATRKSD